jgi:hypothetical protein
MTTSATRAEEKETPVAREPKPIGVTAALAAIDQRTADLAAAEKAAAESAADAAALREQIAALEDRIRAGDPEAQAAQLVELQGLSRFADLQSEAAVNRVIEATNQRRAAEARALIARISEYAVAEEAEWSAVFWATVELAARLRQLDDARTAQSAVFAAQREAAHHALLTVGDSEGLAALAASPRFETHVYEGAVLGLALREAFPNDAGARYVAKAAGLPGGGFAQVEHFPSLAANRPGAAHE